ncbi:hypothetical protein P154DRAFT_606619 [Amniculicola lignicola CBS 123094]|uniref:Peptidase C14 caspase domain-containing protein n=1 Tax=Amniculicola lignicola CBS 123094 TaxID=1392246 RepID=A0A6A5WAX9_9PLEO|nr:hypothetical protein P154DRAFT_606619 [Amniculicola lignicola CBS 123094]
MSGTKRALLIASPYDGLKGPLEDAKAFRALLVSQGFHITECCGCATRSRIIERWQDIINSALSQDTIVIYYSGHGAIVESDEQDSEPLSSPTPWRYQFLVPMDYGESTDDDFRGILDVEIAQLLRLTTEKTENVTIILDCCHSGRMSRDPKHGSEAMPRFLQTLRHHDIAKHVKRLREIGALQGEAYLQGNPYAVRIVAAAASETAWSYENANGEWRGAMTGALIRAITESVGHDVSWRTTLLRVSELVNVRFCNQHPAVEGPDTRTHFSLNRMLPGAFVIKSSGDFAIIQAGRVSGVREGDVFVIIPFGTDKIDESWIGEATVNHVIGFRAKAEVDWRSADKRIPSEGALAFIKFGALNNFPVSVEGELSELREAINRSRFLRQHIDDETEPLLYIREDDQTLFLTTNSGAEVALSLGNNSSAAKRTVKQIISVAEQFARSQHLLGLDSTNTQDRLIHNIRITVGTVNAGEKDKLFQQNGEDYVREQDLTFISLQNPGRTTIYISVFNINAMGKISLISEGSPKGIELPPGREYVLGEDEFGLGLSGMLMSWPEGVTTRIRSVDEYLTFILTDAPVDLQHLADSRNPERRDWNMQKGAAGMRIHFDTVQVPFTLRRFGYGNYEALPPEGRDGLAAQDLPPPKGVPRIDSVGDYDQLFKETHVKNLPEGVLGAGVLPRGGTLSRPLSVISAKIWVVNEHTEEIAVVVSQYRPNCLLTGFGVITIFTGSEKKVSMVNDQIMAGTTAYFTNTPNLKIGRYGSVAEELK